MPHVRLTPCMHARNTYEPSACMRLWPAWPDSWRRSGVTEFSVLGACICKKQLGSSGISSRQFGAMHSGTLWYATSCRTEWSRSHGDQEPTGCLYMNLGGVMSFKWRRSPCWLGLEEVIAVVDFAASLGISAAVAERRSRLILRTPPASCYPT